MLQNTSYASLKTMGYSVFSVEVLVCAGMIRCHAICCSTDRHCSTVSTEPAGGEMEKENTV